ncbi:MAG: HigA family addiction module antitoxin [Chloroflexota bacterium]|nr:HigA family addiction module antidote protein [Chloroflexota bacterium]
MSQSLTPARVTAPGTIIKQELEARGWTQNDLAEIMGRPTQAISEIIRGAKQITPETALELAAAFDTSPQLWTNLEANYRLYLARKKEEENKGQDGKKIARKSLLYNLAPVAELGKRSWIRVTDSLDELEKEVCKFMVITSPKESPQMRASFRQTKERGPELNSQIAWLRRVEQLARMQKVAGFNLEKLKSAIPEILALAGKLEDIVKIPLKLLKLGIHFVVVRHLPKTFIDGATFFLEQNPVIAITLRYDRIDAFWFTLMHELAHLILGHQEHLDNLYDGQEELEELDDQHKEEENAANEQARNWLLESAAFTRFVEETQPYFSEAKIVRFAENQGRHPGIVIGQLQYEKHISYNHLRKMLVKVSPLLNEWIDGIEYIKAG